MESKIKKIFRSEAEKIFRYIFNFSMGVFMNITAVKNFKNLDVGTKILFTVLLCAGDMGQAELKKTTIADYLELTPQTVGKHLKIYADCQLLKYKYSGLIRVNPNFYYNGAPELQESAVQEYNSFKSDI